jgi:hypothetical protein
MNERRELGVGSPACTRNDNKRDRRSGSTLRAGLTALLVDVEITDIVGGPVQAIRTRREEEVRV